MNTQLYIENVLKHIKNKSFKRELEDELMAHIHDRIDYFADIGYNDEEAEQKAVEQMGDADELGEKLNRLHGNKAALGVSILLIVVFAVCMIYYFRTALRFMVISTDGGELEPSAFIASAISLLSVAVCYRISLKNRFPGVAVTLGALNIAAVAAPFLFLPAGYSIIGFFTDFPAVFIDKEFYFFYGQISWGIDSYIDWEWLISLISWAEIIFTAMFFLSPLINGIMAIRCGLGMIKDENFVLKEKHFKRFSLILCLLAAFSAIAVTSEISADLIKADNYNKYIQSSFYSDHKNSQEIFDELAVPMRESDVLDLASVTDDEDLLNDLDHSIFTVSRDLHYTVQLRDDDEDGVFETKRIYLIRDRYLAEKEIAELDENMSSGQMIRAVSDSICDYWYTIDGEVIRERIYVKTKTKDLSAAEERETYYIFTFENGEQISREKEII